MEQRIKSVAKKFGVFQALISQLRRSLENAIDRCHGLDQLVEYLQLDRAIAIYESFLKIAGKCIYIIIATGYSTHKVLGLKVSSTRKEEDRREVFEEA